ncbi:MAG TPA: FHIPEP family type III secretion protein, partial [Pirellulales bacterium]
VRIDRSTYRIKLSDAVIAEGEVQAGKILALDWGGARGDLPGRPTTDPALGLPAVWIDPGLKEQAERQGYTLTDAAGVLATHLTQVIRRHSDELLSREATKHLLESLKRTAPAVVEELIPNQLKLGDVQRVLQLLLREGVPIRNLAGILETLGDHAGRTKQPEELVEAVRARLGRTLCARYRDPSKRLYVVTLDPHWEDRIAAATTATGARAALAPSTIEEICRLTTVEVEKLEAMGRPAIIVVGPRVRSSFKQLTSSRLPDLVVLSYAEITPDTRLDALGMVRDATAVARAG